MSNLLKDVPEKALCRVSIIQDWEILKMPKYSQTAVQEVSK